MRLLVALSLLAALMLPKMASAQSAPVVVIGPAPTTSGPPPQAVPTVPPGYEIEGDVGGMHFRARLSTPAPQAAPTPAPRPIIVMTGPLPHAAAPTYTYAQPQYAQPYQPQYAQPQYAQPTPYAQPAPRRGPRLDTGMEFGGRLALELVGAAAGFGIATALAYATNDGRASDSGFAVTQLIATAGLVPAGISIFGGAIAGSRGRYGGAMLGEMIGGGLSGLIILAGGIQFQEPWEMIAAIAGPAILGAIIGFEAQHGLRTARLERQADREQVQLSSLSVAPLAQGNGAVIGLGGTF